MQNTDKLQSDKKELATHMARLYPSTANIVNETIKSSGHTFAGYVRIAVEEKVAHDKKKKS